MNLYCEWNALSFSFGQNLNLYHVEVDHQYICLIQNIIYLDCVRPRSFQFISFNNWMTQAGLLIWQILSFLGCLFKSNRNKHKMLQWEYFGFGFWLWYLFYVHKGLSHKWYDRWILCWYLHVTNRMLWIEGLWIWKWECGLYFTS